MKYQNKVLVVSGVTSGIGMAIAIKFGELGWNVVGLARNKKKLEKLQKHIGSNFLGLKVDLTHEENIINAFNIIDKKFENIDLIVNNAAVFKMEEFYKCSFSDINTIIDTNLKGVMFSTLEAIKIMKKSRHPSRIINIGSVASVHGIENQAIYCASKFGLNGFSEALNQEIIKNNISITTIFPGGVNTPLWNENNPYPGNDIEKILKINDIVEIVEFVSKLEPRIILKNMTIFPSNEWH